MKALKHAYQFRGMASTLRLRTTLSPRVEAACRPKLDQKLQFLPPKRDKEQPRHFRMRAPPWN